MDCQWLPIQLYFISSNGVQSVHWCPFLSFSESMSGLYTDVRCRCWVHSLKCITSSWSQAQIYFQRSGLNDSFPFSVMGSSSQLRLRLHSDVKWKGGFFSSSVEILPANYFQITSNQNDRKLTFGLRWRQQKTHTTVGHRPGTREIHVQDSRIDSLENGWVESRSFKIPFIQ